MKKKSETFLQVSLRQLSFLALIWAILIGISYWAAHNPAAFEQSFGTWFYYYSSTLTRLMALLPFDLASVVQLIIYALLPFILLIKSLLQFKGWWRKILTLGLRLGVYGSAVLLLIQLTYGLNLKRNDFAPLFAQTNELSEQERARFIDYAVYASNNAAAENQFDGFVCSELSQAMMHYNDDIRFSQGLILQNKPYRVTDHGEVKPALISPIMQRLGIGGEYFWLTAEPRINHFLPPLHSIYVMAHERAHLNGIAHENFANHLATFTLVESNNSELNYVGWLSVWRQIRHHPWYQEAATQLSPAFVKDWQCEQQWRDQQIKPWPKLSSYFWQVYDRLFKANGVSEGIQSYQVNEHELVSLLHFRMQQRLQHYSKIMGNESKATKTNADNSEISAVADELNETPAANLTTTIEPHTSSVTIEATAVLSSTTVSSVKAPPTKDTITDVSSTEVPQREPTPILLPEAEVTPKPTPTL